MVGFRPSEFKLVSLYELVTAHLGPLANDHFWQWSKGRGNNPEAWDLANAASSLDVEYQLHRIFNGRGLQELMQEEI